MPAFLGYAPMSINDVLNQRKRWQMGFLEVGLSKDGPLVFGFRHMNPVQALCYAHFCLRALWSIPVIIYAFLPQLTLVNSTSIFPKVSESWFFLYVFLFLGAYGKDLVDFTLAEGEVRRWWNSQRMWLIWGLSCHPFALCDWLLKSLGMSTLEFNVTSKVLDSKLRKRYEKGVFEFGVESPFFLSISVAAVVNLFAFLVGTTLVFKNRCVQDFFVQIFVAGFAVIHSWPIYEAMVWRNDKRKMPLVTTLKSIDDGGSQLTLFAFMEAAKFARHWHPYCRKYDIADRSPEVYFRNNPTWFPETEKIKDMYESFKVKVANVMNRGSVDLNEIVDERWINAFSKWTPGFTRQTHPTVIEVLLDNSKDKDVTDSVMPNLIYLSREKSKAAHHNFKAGALNVLIRVSAAMTNAPIFLPLDCDMYSNDPKTPLRMLCHFLDPNMDSKLSFVQFPQRFHNINKTDIYGAEFRTEVQVFPLGQDGLQGTIFVGTGGFFRRNTHLGSPSLVTHSEFEQVNQQKLEKEPIQSEKVLKLAYHVASSSYEENTKWGNEVGFRYGCLVEDVYTSFRMHCQGWKSVFCNPKRAAFLGNAPMSLHDVLNQTKRWYMGFIELALSEYSPITYGVRSSMNPLQALGYTHYCFRSFWSIPIMVYAFLPQLSLVNSTSIFPKVSDSWFFLYAFLFLGAYGKDLFDFTLSGGSVPRCWNNQRMWLIWGCSSFPFALCDWLLKSLGLSTFEFNVTNKVSDKDLNQRYENGMFEFGVESPLFLSISVAAVVNLIAFLKGIFHVFKSGSFDEFFMQMFIAGYAVINSWPIYEAMVLRSDKGKMPLMITLKSIGIALVIYSASSLAF